MADEIPTGRRRMPLRWLFLIVALISAPAAFFHFQGDTVSAAIIAFAGIAGLAGYRAGAISILLLLGSATIAFWVAPSLGMANETKFSSWFGTTGLTNRIVSILVVGFAVIAIGSFVAMFLRRRLASRPKLEAANHWAGFGLGLLEGGVAMALLLGGILMVESREIERAPLRDPADTRGQMVSKFILETSSQTRQSLIGSAIAQNNPFKTIPQLQKFEQVQDTVDVLKDPNKIQHIMYHPSIKELQQSHAVQRAVSELQDDPEIADILRSQQVDRSMAMKLLSHPAVLRLVDQPEFIERAGTIIQSLGTR